MTTRAPSIKRNKIHAPETSLRMNYYLSLLSNVIGFVLSMYGHYVSINKESYQDYQALCDISEKISCSKVLTSKYSKGLGIAHYFVNDSSMLNLSNSVIGMFFYGTYFLLCTIKNSKFICKMRLILASASIVGSVYLASLLIIMGDFCLVCAGIYLVNASNLYLSYRKLMFLNRTSTISTRKKLL